MTALPASLGAAGNGPTSPPSRALSVGAALPAGSTHLAVAALPHPRTVPHRMLSGGLVIDPNASYTSEPAPMGITDYGVTPSGVGYSYATPVVQGSATIDSFAVADGSSGTNMTFQLNVEDVVVSGSSSFVFWVQDVAFFDTQSHLIFWEDNVWNLTGGTGNLYTSSVAGNGTVYSSYYYADVANGYPGSGVVLSEPTTISARVVATNASGTPHVGFEYSDGDGWVTFDNVTFPFTSVGVEEGFLVDGFDYTPSGGYYDAEWDLSGPGGGQTQAIRTADMNLSLSVWNGHNLQAVRAAYNHGGNTAESMSNAIDGFAADNATGALYAHTVNGSGGLGALYGPGSTSTLRVITANVSAGTLALNGTDVSFIGSLANLTLAPGTYTVDLEVNGSVVGSANVTLVAGEFLAITIAPYNYYPLRFVSYGLPTGQPWSVTVAGVPLSGTDAALLLSMRSGNYSYDVAGVGGYYLPTYAGVVDVPATDLVTLSWLPTVYVSEFLAENDPGGVPWNVAVDGQNVSGTALALFVSLPNGTFAYAASAPRAESLYPATGDAQVAGAGTMVYISFAVSPGVLRGSIVPGFAHLTVAGTPENVSDGAFELSLPPGNYTVVATLAGYQPYSGSVSLAAGGTESLNITLVPVPATPGSNSSSHPGGLWGLAWSSWALIGLGVAALVALAAIAALRRPRPPAPARTQ
jgi:hypothetical protein